MSTPNTIPQQVPVIVIGGGPAGSTVVDIVCAKQGHRVVLFERDHFPRFHIGESLIPETYWVLKRLSMLDKMKSSHFVKKYSVQFVSQQRQAVRAVLFHRSQAARMLADLAGAAQRVRQDDARQRPRAWRRGPRRRPRARSSLRRRPGRRREARRRGRQRESPRRSRRRRQRPRLVIVNRLGMREWDPVSEEGGRLDLLEGRLSRRRPRRGGDARPADQGQKGLVLVHSRCTTNIVSVGIVAGFDYLFKDRDDKDHETIYYEEVDRCPEVEAASRDGHCAATDSAAEGLLLPLPPGGRRWLGAGRRCLRIPRSALFLRRAAGPQIGPAGRRRDRRRLVQGRHLGRSSSANGARIPSRAWTACAGWSCEYYDGFSFGRFVKQHPDHKGHLTDLLIGDLFKNDFFDETFRLVDEMKQSAAPQA